MVSSPLTAPYVLLNDCRDDSAAGESLLFTDPIQIIRANNYGEVGPALAALDKAISNGFHAAGWIAFEVAAHFEQRLSKRLMVKDGEPLIWLLVVKETETLSRGDVEALLEGYDAPILSFTKNQTTKNEYLDTIKNIKNYIDAGDVYQINHTFELPFTVKGDPLALYSRLRKSQPVAFGAVINTGEQHVLSLSPELFLEKTDTIITTRPMKGTAARGMTPEEDKALGEALQKDEKNRAENLMIVDLLRNDLSRIAVPGTVRVDALFKIETYETVLQMTSTISAEIDQNQSPSDILKALFPCGSVTGAPKIRAIEIIQEMEQAPRGIYCGAIGHFKPSGDITLNVPIRTLVTQEDGTGRLNVGSGVVADSVAEDEYSECLLKGQFLTNLNPPYDLIETMRWVPDDGFLRLESHLTRLMKSAHTFLRPFNRDAITDALKQAVIDIDGPQRVRLTLGGDGEVTVTAAPLEEPSDKQATICFARTTVCSSDPLLSHKTTRRAFYDDARLEAVAADGVIDVIFTNERGEITEGAISSVFAKIGDTLHTPPLVCGVLPGVMRQTLLSNPAINTAETILTKEMVLSADALFICNSVRELVPVTLLPLHSTAI